MLLALAGSTATPATRPLTTPFPPAPPPLSSGAGPRAVQDELITVAGPADCCPNVGPTEGWYDEGRTGRLSGTGGCAIAIPAKISEKTVQKSVVFSSGMRVLFIAPPMYTKYYTDPQSW